ncbi:uncharacterized protein LOC105850147 isoform X4 [Hydra vulgaris]|uniref:uncharacterized protein LOC105850147 isoform X4 n=1 Tax=Hydra vulgaris TaxID=6087 RepID=UPI001F5E88C2|nr:uncharacterized protein LOC105850147 isoform X5 [Hydra vulgaris]XP_047143714.1 uncharacterized protein LOC105850147 isoform X5 [Hydra vulgaris]
MTPTLSAVTHLIVCMIIILFFQNVQPPCLINTNEAYIPLESSASTYTDVRQSIEPTTTITTDQISFNVVSSSSSSHQCQYKFDIDSMLKDHPKGASILSEYERTGQLVLMKDLFVRIIVGNLVKDSNCYPNTEKKKALALEVINRFPTLRSGNGDGYDAYFRQYVEVLRNGKVKKYSPSDYIEERLKTLRKQLPITDKPHKPHQKRLRTDAVDLVNGPITEYFTEDERVLTHELLNETPNENRIKIIMASTYESRSLWVREGRPPIKTFFSSFPPLRNIYSSAFEEEFCRSAPKSKRLVDGLGDCFSRILLYAKGKRKGLSTDLTILLDEIAANNNLLEDTKEEYALLLLPLMLTVPMRNRQRASVAEVCKRFIQLHPYGTSMDEILSKIKSDSIKQPIIIALGVTGNISQSFIVVENEVIESRCMVSAVDKCFKLHYIGQIEYDQSVSHVWQFLQVHFYGILDNVPISECVRDLVTFLKAR